MNIVETLIEKVTILPKVKQQKVLDFVDQLTENEKPVAPRRSLQGALAHLNIKFTEADMRQARNEMWRGYTKDTEDEK